MNWVLLIVAYHAMDANTAPPAPVTFHEMGFSSEERCMAAKQKLSTDWKKTMAGSDGHVTYMIAATCLER
jgi:hypothetical protein